MFSKPLWPGRKKAIRKLTRGILQNEVVVILLSWLATRYLKLVVATNQFIVKPEDAVEQVSQYEPMIVAVWHGQHILLPAIPIELNGVAMVSRNFDGEITARTIEYFGNETVRASGGRLATASLKKGGMTGFLEMLRALKDGKNVVQTADIPKGVARRAGLGIVNLAKRSNAPILPLAIASSKRLTFDKAWDKAAVNLPFGKTAICIGKPIHVTSDASDDMLEAAREQLQGELNEATMRAYELSGKPE